MALLTNVCTSGTHRYVRDVYIWLDTFSGRGVIFEGVVSPVALTEFLVLNREDLWLGNDQN